MKFAKSLLRLLDLHRVYDSLPTRHSLRKGDVGGLGCAGLTGARRSELGF